MKFNDIDFEDYDGILLETEVWPMSEDWKTENYEDKIERLTIAIKRLKKQVHELKTNKETYKQKLISRYLKNKSESETIKSKLLSGEISRKDILMFSGNHTWLDACIETMDNASKEFFGKFGITIEEQINLNKNK